MEMKNICGKIPVDLHEKMKLEIEELGISIPKYLETVIEEHMTRKGEKTNMADLRTVAVQDVYKRQGMHLSEKAQCGIPETAKENTATYREVSSDRNIYGVERVNQPNDRRA